MRISNSHRTFGAYEGNASSRTLLYTAVAAFAVIYLVWGSTYLGIRFAIETIPPLFMTGFRCIAAGAVLYSWGWKRSGELATPKQWCVAIVVGAFMFLGGQGLVAWAELRVASGVAALLVATSPLWMLMLRGVVEDGFGGWRTAVGILGGLLGVMVLIGPTNTLGSEPIDRLGGLVLVGCAMSWAVGSALSRATSRPRSHLVASGMYLLAGGASLFLAGVFAGEVRQVDLGNVSARSLLALGYLIVFGSIVAFAAYYWLLQRVSLTTISTHAYVNPVIAVFLGWALGGEALTSRVVLASILVVGAVALTLSERPAQARRTYPHPPVTPVGRSLASSGRS